MISMFHEILKAVGGVFTDLAIENGHTVYALVLSVLFVVVLYLRKPSWANASWCPAASSSRILKGIVVFCSCITAVLLAAYGGWGKSVLLEVKGSTGASRSAVVAVLTNNGPNKLGTAEIYHTDAQGVVETWGMPGKYNYLLIQFEQGQLFYSTATRNKAFGPLEIEFSPPFLSIPLIEISIDRFIFDGVQLPVNGKPIFDKLQNVVKNDDQWYLITGHTDYEGDDGYNMNLGMKRAKCAADYLESLGVPRHHIIIASCGARYPAVRNDGDGDKYGKGEPLDRRVEVLCIPNPYQRFMGR